MAHKGKRLKAAEATIDPEKLYPLDEAVRAVKAAAKAKFDETVECALNLGVDPRHADQRPTTPSFTALFKSEHWAAHCGAFDELVAA